MRKLILFLSLSILSTVSQAREADLKGLSFDCRIMVADKPEPGHLMVRSTSASDDYEFGKSAQIKPENLQLNGYSCGATIKGEKQGAKTIEVKLIGPNRELSPASIDIDFDQHMLTKLKLSTSQKDAEGNFAAACSCKIGDNSIMKVHF